MTPSTRGLAEEVIDSGEAEVTAAFIAFLEAASRRRHPSGPIRRFNQGRAAGCVNAEFIVPADLPSALRVGLFAAPGTYPAFIRFANASSATDREKDVRGMSISIAGVRGENLTPGSTSQDFVLNSHPVMVAPDTKEFMAFLEANEAGGLRRILYFASHPALARIGLAAARKSFLSPGHPLLEHDALSVRCGPGGQVRRQARVGPLQPDAFAAERHIPRRRAQTRLDTADARFEFLVQFQTDAARMPIEDATVEWKEAESPYVAVASIRIPRQQIAAPGTGSCEEVAFNPWHSLVEHRPLGNLNRARRAIYPALSEFRRRRA